MQCKTKGGSNVTVLWKCLRDDDVLLVGLLNNDTDSRTVCKCEEFTKPLQQRIMMSSEVLKVPSDIYSDVLVLFRSFCGDEWKQALPVVPGADDSFAIKDELLVVETSAKGPIAARSKMTEDEFEKFMQRANRFDNYGSPMNDPELVDVTHFQRYGPGMMFKFWCKFRELKNTVPVKWVYLATNPDYVRVMQLAGWNMKIEREHHHETGAQRTTIPTPEAKTTSKKRKRDDPKHQKSLRDSIYDLEALDDEAMRSERDAAYDAEEQAKDDEENVYFEHLETPEDDAYAIKPFSRSNFSGGKGRARSR